MPRSSESVAALASALAKAQAELTNPEKSLVATLPAERGQPERAFRYASLAGGLDIVRKTLGRHEIATIQSTAIDRDSGTIKLTTTLAHASGEWIASDWPVCALAEMPTPHRMGTALTYARRYGLFTMVGIAGEDDLDAPDLLLQSSPPAQMPSPPPASALRGKKGKSPPSTPVIMLDPDVSGRQRDEFLLEIGSIASFDGAAEWAKRIIPIKNTMMADHARDVEAALERKLKETENGFDAVVPPSEAPISSAKSDVPSPSTGEVSPAGFVASLALGSTSALVFEDYAVTLKTRRLRDKRHRQFVAAQACVICGRQPSDAHHLRFAQPRGLGLKVSDEFTVPLCRSHHRDLHRTANEISWWAQFGIQPKGIAYKLWTTTHPTPTSVHPAGPGIEAPAPAEVIDQSLGAPQTTPVNTNCEPNPIQLPGRHDVA
jgi:hypothetical protein